MQAQIDLVAVAYQAPQETKKFLDSLINVEVPFTLSVIENNSPDRTVRDVLYDAEPAPMCVWQEVIYNDTNVGYAKAINQGISIGDAPYAAALNCDVEFLPGEGVGKILDMFADNPSVGIIGPRTTDSNGRLTHAGILSAEAGPHAGRDIHRAWYVVDNEMFHDTLKVPTVSGATFFLRRNMWEELVDCTRFQQIAPECEGAFLPTKHFYEETWCCYHARAHGWDVVYLGSAHMIHQWHRSSPVGSISLTDAENYFKQACEVHGIELSF